MRRPHLSDVETYARSLAALWLTRCPTLRAVDHYGFIFGPDLLVSLENGGRRSGRQFGAVIKASETGEAPPRITARELRRERERFADHSYPVCMLAFPISGEPGWFRWILQPGSCDGCTDLHFADCIGFVPATDELRRQIIDQVNHWYDARKQTS